jgi:hypothetical protein
MTMTLDGTLGITATGSLTGLTTPITAAQGGTGAATLTANNVLLGNGTSAVTFVAPSTSGNLLTSNGTAWVSSAPAASGGMTLLGTLTPTVANSISLGSLTLTNYKALFISFTVTVNTAGNYFFVNSSSLQSGIQVYAYPSSKGTFWLDLATGSGGGGTEYVTSPNGYLVAIGGTSSISTATTTIYFRLASTDTFLATGSIKVYGVA